MAEEKLNKHGLSRTIPEDVKRNIRQKSGFGCVVCGLAIGDYHHVDPEFAEAKEHNADKMTFLCIRHHGAASRGRMATETVKHHMETPKALEQGFSNEDLYVGLEKPTVVLGNITAIQSSVIIEHEGTPIFWIDEPEEVGGPYRINAEFTNQKGETIFSIHNNEWQVRTGSWDVKVIGRRTTIHNARGDIALVVRTDPPNRLVVERMNMMFDGFSFKTNSDAFYIEDSAGLQVQGHDVVLTRCQCAISHKAGRLILGVGCESSTAGSISNGDPVDFAKSRRVQPIQPPQAQQVRHGEPKPRGVLWQMVQDELVKRR